MLYRIVDAAAVPVGEAALCLFIDAGDLCAGILEHRPDGRFIRKPPSRPGIDGVLPAIGEILARGAGHLLIVLEPGAYWPENFPRIEPRPVFAP